MGSAIPFPKTMKSLPGRLFHASLFGILLGALLATMIHGIQQRFQGPPKEPTVVEIDNDTPGHTAPFASPGTPTGDDLDGDGIPNTWEEQFHHDPENFDDCESDFDHDGLTAYQEYELWLATNGVSGNPLGKWQWSEIPVPEELAGCWFYPIKINNRGDVLAGGGSYTNSDFFVYLVKSNGDWIKIESATGPGGMNYFANDLNDSGTVVGSAMTADGLSSEPFIWDPVDGYRRFVHEGLDAYAWKINNQGDWVGNLTDPVTWSSYPAYVVGGENVDSGADPSTYYLDINDAGEAFGTYGYSSSNPTAFLAIGPWRFDTGLPCYPPAFSEATLSYRFGGVMNDSGEFTSVDVWSAGDHGALNAWLYNGTFHRISVFDTDHWEFTTESVNNSGLTGGMASDGMYGGTYLYRDGVAVLLSELLPSLGQSIIFQSNDSDEFVTLSSSTEELIRVVPDQDQDGDGMPDDWELYRGHNPAVDDGNVDSDGDGVNNYLEFLFRDYSPNDYREGIDNDIDGMPNPWEFLHGLDPNDFTDSLDDPDQDGLTNLQEYRLHTNPNDSDTDNDGVSDGKEALTNGTNPLVYRDLDNDGMPDDWELDFCQRLLAHRDILTPEQIAILETNNLDPQTDILDEGVPNIQRSQEERNTPITSSSADRVFQTKTRLIVLGRIYPFNPEFPDAISYVWMQYHEGSDLIASSNKDWASATQTFGELETKLPWSGSPWWTTASGDGVYGSGWPLLSGMRNHDQGGGYGFSHSESMVRIKAHEIFEEDRLYSYFERVQSINRNSPEQEPTENVVRTHTFTVPAGKTLSQEIKVDSAALQNGIDSTTHLFPVEVEQEGYTSGKGIRFCRWLDSFTGNTLKPDCADKDRDRFRIRISGVVPNLTKIHIKSFWLTTAVIGGLWEPKSTDGGYDVTMIEENGAMVSKWMLLVSDGDDDEQYNGIGTDNGLNDQTLLADFNSPIEVTLPEYQNAKVTFKAQKPLGDLEIQPYYLSPAGDVPPDMEKFITNHLLKMQEIYRQIGVRVGHYEIAGKAVPQAWFDAGANEAANYFAPSESNLARAAVRGMAVPGKQIRIGFVNATLMQNGINPWDLPFRARGFTDLGTDGIIVSVEEFDARRILGVTAHEVGHTLGLPHPSSNSWKRWLMRGDGGDEIIWDNKPSDSKRFQSGDFEIIRNSIFYVPH